MTGETRSDPVTTDRMLREIALLRDTMDTRFAGMDKAAEVLSSTVNRVPTDLQVATNALKDFNAEIVRGLISTLKQVELKFEAETAAIRDAARMQHANDTIATEKSDANFKELLNKQEGLLNAIREGLAGKLVTLETRLATFEAVSVGSRDTRSESRANLTMLVTVAGFVLALVVGVIGFNLGHGSNPPEVVTAPSNR